MSTLYPIILIVFLTNIAESLSGFGATVLALTLGAFFFPIEDLVPILIPLNMVVNLAIIILYPQHIQIKELSSRILPLTLIGLPIGILIFQRISGVGIQILFGIIVTVLGFYEFSKAIKSKTFISTPLRRIHSFIILFFGGIIHGAYGSGGPFVVYYASKSIPEKTTFRSTISLLWLILNVIVIITLALTHKINFFTLKLSLLLLPSVLVGMGVGFLIHSKVSERGFRIGVYGLLALSGISLLYQSL